MSFLKSAINQVGRDMGKVVSNQIFKDSHSTPYRKIGSTRTNSQIIKKTHNIRSVKSEFDKAIEFQTSFKPNTLINKISGAYTVVKNETNSFIADGYLDTEESTTLFDMMNKFSSKIEDLCEILELDEKGNEKEIEQLSKIIEKTNILFKETLKLSAEGCEIRKAEHIYESENIKSRSYLGFVGLHMIWMGKYARGEEKSLVKTILANIFITLPLYLLPLPILFLVGSFHFPKEYKRVKKLKKAHADLAELEGKRAIAYLEIA